MTTITDVELSPEQDNEIKQNLRNYCHTLLGDVEPDSPSYHDCVYFLSMIELHATVHDFIKGIQDVIDFLQSPTDQMTLYQDIVKFAQKSVKARLLWFRFKKGETLHMRNPRTGFVFDIRPEYSEKFMTTTVLGYSFVQNGRAVRGYNRLMLDRDAMLDCLFQNEEVQQ